jgi:hypothetical protein
LRPSPESSLYHGCQTLIKAESRPNAFEKRADSPENGLDDIEYSPDDIAPFHSLTFRQAGVTVSDLIQAAAKVKTPML